MKKIVIGLIDSGSGNIGSIKKAILKTVKNKPFTLKIIKSKKDFKDVNKIILPGQGAFATLINNLHKKDLYKELLKLISEFSIPYLGICVGMQILATYGHENKKIKGLDIIGGDIVKFKKKDLIIPHMGWNNIHIKKPNKVFDNALDQENVYFVHSYKFIPDDESHVSSKTSYSEEIIASVEKDNLFGTQFHPEKSDSVGLQIIKNFINL